MGDPRASGEAIERLDAITRRLRVECPWDREQDARSIVPHTVEEAYELANAVAEGDDAEILDELGDVLFQVHFLALLLEERGAGDLAAVADACREKLIRRHPHVFGEESGESAALIAGAGPQTAGDVLGNWDRIKQEVEGGGEGDAFAGVPENLPGLLHARKLQRRGESRGGGAGLAADHLEAAGRARSAIAELEALTVEGGDAGPTADPELRDAIEHHLGEALFALVDVARRLRCDPELALRGASARFRRNA